MTHLCAEHGGRRGGAGVRGGHRECARRRGAAPRSSQAGTKCPTHAFLPVYGHICAGVTVLPRLQTITVQVLR